MVSGRILVFDVIKLFAIFLVIWGHCLLHLQNYQYEIWDNPLYRWICSFHMPLFMMISGFFSSRLTNFKIYVEKKFHQLLLPALTFGVLFVISWHFVCGGGVLKPYVLCYWFLKSAFICALLYYLANFIKNKILGYSITIIISICCYFYMVNLMYIPFITGVCLFRNKELIVRHSIILMLLSGCLFILMFYKWDFQMASMPLLRIYKYMLDPTLPRMSYHIYCYLYKVIMGVAGSIAVITLFINIAKVVPASKFGLILGSWGTLTLGIYLWQAILLEHIMMRSIDLSRADNNMFNYIFTPILSLCVLGICVILTKILKKNKWTHYIFLGGPFPERIKQ